MYAGRPSSASATALFVSSRASRQGLALDQLRRHGARGDGGAAAERFELDVRNLVIIDLQIDLHDIAALGIADLADAVGILDDADIARIAGNGPSLFRYTVP